MAEKITERAAMLRAVQLSKRGFPAPNPRVGCVLVKNGVVVGEGHHDHAGGPHAEVSALVEAAGAARGADVFVTLEPCSHYGRTPPCVDALVLAGVRSVFYAVDDPNPVAGGGGGRLRSAGIEVFAGLCRREAGRANQPYLTATRRQRPYVCLKLAVSLDGFIARPDGASKWITGDEARADGHRLRAEMGAVLVGRRTVELDDPELTARIEGVVNQPVSIILDGCGKLGRSSKLLRRASKALWIVGPDAQADSGTSRVSYRDGSFDLVALMDLLWSNGITAILVEGGAKTAASFLRAGMVDRIELYVAPVLFGKGVRGLDLEEVWARQCSLRFVGSKRFGQDIRLTYEHF